MIGGNVPGSSGQAAKLVPPVPLDVFGVFILMIWHKCNEKGHLRFFASGLSSGAEGDRTLNLRIANATLSQLSYRPA